MVNGISVVFNTRVYDDSEVIVLRYRANGVLGSAFFTETSDSRSALDNMMIFVYRLMGCAVG